MSKYKFSVKTADELYAGTDSNIFIIMHGAKGISHEERLNPHIHGNAFERNHTDKFEIDFKMDLGEIYQIEMRSDCHHLGSDWNCNYIEIGKASNDQRSMFEINKWIKDKTTRTIPVTSGFDQKIENVDYKYIEQNGPIYNVAAGSKNEITLKTTIDHSIDYSKVKTTSVETHAGIKIPVKIVELDFSAGMNVMIEDRLHIKLGEIKEETSTTTYDNSKSDKNVELQAIYGVKLDTIDSIFGDCEFDLAIEDNKKFLGFKNLSTNKMVNQDLYTALI